MHLNHISVAKAVELEDLQQLLCVTSKVLHDSLESKGGSLPLVNYFYSKCNWDNQS